MAGAPKDTAVMSALCANGELMAQLVTVPDAYRLPVQGSSTETFLIIWPIVRESAFSFAGLWSVMRICITVCDEMGILRSLAGVQIVPCEYGRHESPERILRFSVESRAVDELEHLNCRDLCKNRFGQDEFEGWNFSPRPGVTCSWYVDPSSISV